MLINNTYSVKHHILYIEMGIFKSCCWGEVGSRCCNIISLLGFVYFGLNFLIFESQKNFYEFHMENPNGTRTAMMVCSLIYLLFFIITFIRIMMLNKIKNESSKQMHSIHEKPEPIHSFIEKNKQPTHKQAKQVQLQESEQYIRK